MLHPIFRAMAGLAVGGGGGGGGSFDTTNGNFQLYYDFRTVTSGTIQNRANPGTGDLTLGGGVSHQSINSGDFQGLQGSGGAGMACSRTASQIAWDANKTKAFVAEYWTPDTAPNSSGLFSVGGLGGGSPGTNIKLTDNGFSSVNINSDYNDVSFSGAPGYGDAALRVVWVQEDATTWKAFAKWRRSGQAWSGGTTLATQSGTFSGTYAIATGAPIVFFNGSSNITTVGMLGLIAGAITDTQAAALRDNPYQPIGG